jgi:small subunit ribosomal protein S20
VTEEVVDLPNIKSAKKRVRVIEAKTAINRRVKSSLKTSIKKAQAAIAEGDPASANEAYRSAQRDIDRAVARGILHKNTAARRKSRLVAKMAAPAR